MQPQPGIFALGATDHVHLEFDLTAPGVAADWLRAAVGLAADFETTGGVNVVIGLRPELWASLADPADVLPGSESWDGDLVGPDGFTMPATQHDGWLWIAGGARSAVFDAGRRAVSMLAPHATVSCEIGGWLYRHTRDLTGFVDGTENPSQLAAPAVVTPGPGEPGAGCSVVLMQLWRHRTAEWTALGDTAQERVIGRSKADSVELPEDDMPDDAHVARTVLERDGQELPIYRRNVAYGGVTDHGTVFVGFSREQWRLAEMLRRMAGIGDGVRCALTRYATPLTGAYYAVPSVTALADYLPADG